MFFFNFFIYSMRVFFVRVNARVCVYVCVLYVCDCVETIKNILFTKKELLSNGNYMK